VRKSTQKEQPGKDKRLTASRDNGEDRERLRETSLELENMKFNS
jgi:hypothetical protein